MEPRLLQADFSNPTILDTFESLIWSDRFNETGDFELTTYPDATLLSVLKTGCYLVLKESEHAMIVEEIWIISNKEQGNKMIARGRSLESILDRRIIWGTPTVIQGNFQNGVLQLLNENVISPDIPERQIPNFTFEASTDAAITSLTVDAQFTGDNLLDVIQVMCQSLGVGFKITLTTEGIFVFSLYAGKDRSYRQTTNSYVVFSPDFENVLDSEYSETNTDLKNVALVAGDGEGASRVKLVVSASGAGSGLARREIFTDARYVSRTTDDGTPITEQEYLAQLGQKGIDDLVGHVATAKFEGEVDPTVMFVFGTDFFMGDIIQVSDEYGHETQSRVTELIHSQDNNGVRVYPTFSSLSE